jgi:hypothetical protein
VYEMKEMLNSAPISVTRTPTHETFVYRVHHGGIGHDAHQMGTEAAIQRSCTFLCDDESERLQ